MKRNDTRPLTVNNQEWEYKIGKNTVAIYSPEGERHFPKFTDIVGEKAVLEKDFRLNPAQIKEHILTNILNDQPKRFCKFCHKNKESVRLRYDPFAAEINSDYNKIFLCDTCAADRADEI